MNNVFTNKTIVRVKTDKQAKERSTGRLMNQVRDDGGLDPSENSEGAKTWILQRSC